jgi:uncharacterized protein (TIRG00374 family)
LSGVRWRLRGSKGSPEPGKAPGGLSTIHTTPQPQAAGREAAEPVIAGPPTSRGRSEQSDQPASTEQTPANRGGPRRIVGRVVAIGLTGLALYVVLPSLTRVLAAWPQLSMLSPVWLIGSILAESVSFACAFALQRLVLRTKKWFAVVAAGLAGNAVTNALPGGDAAGATVQFRMLSAAGIDADNAAGGMTAASLLGIGGLLALPLFTLPAILGGAPVNPGLGHTALLGLAGFGLFLAGGLVVMVTDRPLALVGRIAQRLWNSIPGRHTKITGLDRRLLAQRDNIRSTLGRDWRYAVILTAARLGFDYGCLVCALRATGTSPRPSLVLLAYAAAGVLALVPLTPGGLGIVEASLSGLLVLAGVPGGKAFVATLAYRLASYWLPLLAGPVAYLLFRRRYPPLPASGRDELAGTHEA